LTLESKAVRNRLVNEHLGNALKSKSLFTVRNLLIVYRQENTTGHGKIATVDWIIEVVVERLDIKISFEQVEYQSQAH
jgi:3-hydroxyacyl-CoA dehydrogenase